MPPHTPDGPDRPAAGQQSEEDLRLLWLRLLSLVAAEVAKSLLQQSDWTKLQDDDSDDLTAEANG
jgi:hypothetical protein